MPVHKIGDVIAASGGLRALANEARRLKDLQHLFVAAAPPALSSASRVTGLKSGTLTISADNAAIAAKLRQLAPRLLLQFKKYAVEVSGIQVDVQVKTHKIKGEDEVTGPALPPEAIEVFSRLAGQLPPSPLRSAVARLAARGRARRPR